MQDGLRSIEVAASLGSAELAAAALPPNDAKLRADVVSDGNRAADVLLNAPVTDGQYFSVPRFSGGDS